MKVLQTTIIALLFMGLFSTSFADSIETMGGGIYHKENPLVCIMEPEPVIQERFYDELSELYQQTKANNDIPLN